MNKIQIPKTIQNPNLFQILTLVFGIYLSFGTCLPMPKRLRAGRCFEILEMP